MPPNSMEEVSSAIVTTPATQKSLHIAPMLHVSTREFRQFIRILSKKAVLWTEMVVDETIFHHVRIADSGIQQLDSLEGHLGYDEQVEHPIICQVGGMTREYTTVASKMVEVYGYDEINLNMDCPSNRVSGRNFGAALMKDLDRAYEILDTMREFCPNVPNSVKCRIGIDEFDDFDYLVELIQRLSGVCTRFYLHARKCLLKGLSPAQNRIVPPLNYPRVYQICEKFPHLDFWINGGIPGLKAAKEILCGADEPSDHLHTVPCSFCGALNGSCVAPPVNPPRNLHGCLLGRAVMENPSMFWDVDRYFYGSETNPTQSRREVLDKYMAYLSRVYPRRCCDNEDRMTRRIPAPQITHHAPCCSICRPFYDKTCTESAVEDNEEDASCSLHRVPIKFTSHLIGRCMKPVLGLFFNLPHSREYRRRLEELVRDERVRNCGPAFILYKAVKDSIPDEIVDRPFVKTEDLTEADIIVHVSPGAAPCCPEH